jgi:hypothetical protein
MLKGLSLSSLSQSQSLRSHASASSSKRIPCPIPPFTCFKLNGAKHCVTSRLD